MPASFPASMLNQKPSDLGIPDRFKLDPSRSSFTNVHPDVGLLAVGERTSGTTRELDARVVGVDRTLHARRKRHLRAVPKSQASKGSVYRGLKCLKKLY
jgi:hypothetical protein